jgi:AcrR family transcriptional regulator
MRGVTPHQQARSEATFQAFIAAGRKALKDKTFDQMAIGDIARAAGLSVGAFYGRFENKEAFFSRSKTSRCRRLKKIFASDWRTLPCARRAMRSCLPR